MPAPERLSKQKSDTRGLAVPSLQVLLGVPFSTLPVEIWMIKLRLYLAVVGCQFALAQAPMPPQPGQYPPLVATHSEDLAVARSQFKTRLLRSGPPPAEWVDLNPPDGARQIQFQSGSLGLAAWISRPDESPERRHSAVLFLHSGFDLGSEDWKLTKQFRDSGYVVMMPTLRGENGQHGVFTMDYNEVDDVIAAADFLRGLPYVRADHVYVVGYSVGGVLALLAAEMYPHFRGASSISGLTDFASYLRYARGAKENAPFDTSDTQEIELRSPLSYAASFKCPVRMFYGAEEKYFAISVPMTAEIARQHGIDAQAVAVKGDHSSDLDESIRMTADFFNAKK